MIFYVCCLIKIYITDSDQMIWINQPCLSVDYFAFAGQLVANIQQPNCSSNCVWATNLTMFTLTATASKPAAGQCSWFDDSSSFFNRVYVGNVVITPIPNSFGKITTTLVANTITSQFLFKPLFASVNVTYRCSGAPDWREELYVEGKCLNVDCKMVGLLL